jgi:hypothetical protein
MRKISQNYTSKTQKNSQNSQNLGENWQKLLKKSLIGSQKNKD